MGKKLIIKGADFSENGMADSLNITTLAAASGKWFPQYAVSSLKADAKNVNTKRCCLQLFDMSTIPGFSGYSKVQVEFTSGYDYVMSISNDATQAHSYRVSGDETYDNIFEWVTTNQKAVASLSYNELAIKYLSINIRYDDNTTAFPSNAELADYMKITLLK